MPKKNLAELARMTFEPQYGRPLTDQEVQEIITNTKALLRYLYEEHAKDSTSPNKDQAPDWKYGDRN